MNIQMQVAGQKEVALDLPDFVFGADFNEGLVHQVVTAYLSGGRQGTKAQKTRAQVSGGGRKPWNQKGTGQARAGSIRSPLWRSGGIVFAAVPRDHSVKVNKKMHHVAMRSIFSQLVREGRLIAVDQFTVSSAKTKDALVAFKNIPSLVIGKGARKAEGGVSRTLLIVSEAELSEPLLLSTRNIPLLSVLNASYVDPASLLRHDKVVITSKALNVVKENLS